MGGNHTHRTDWFSLYPFPDVILDAYKGKGDTVIGDGAWLGMRSAIIASGAIVTKDVAAYTIVAGNPAVPIRSRFPATTVDTLLGLGIYRWDEKKFDAMRAYLCADDINALVAALAHYDKNSGTAE
ncbi:antibiotic acetyltransferase [Brucella cytisi]|uniref:antibiotic acetyltransferase n=1 Tax=Brucella cytisi TaxID=407152 RepID=UPI00313E3991